MRSVISVIRDNNTYERAVATWATCGLEGHLRAAAALHVDERAL